MSLRKRILRTTGIITLLIIGVLLLVIRTVLLSNYNQLQEKSTRHTTTMVQSELTHEINQLDSSARNWACWDETYQFALGKNPEYIESNLIDSIFDNLNWDFFAVFSNTGDLIYLKTYDLAHSFQISPEADLLNWLKTAPILQPQFKITNVHHGIATLPDNPLLVAVAPILSNLKTETEPEAGKLVVGRYLVPPNSSDTQKITWYEIHDPELPPDLQAVQAALANQDEDIFIKALNDKRITGYFTLPDLKGDPALLVSVEDNRDIYRQGIHTIIIFLVFFVSLGILFGGMALYSLEKGILSRVDIIYSGIRDIGENRDLSQRIHVKGGDELAKLAERINETLAALQNSKSALEENKERFKYDSLHDSLTDLPNRAYFLQQLDLAAERTKTDPNYSTAVLLINLDRFKLINDSFNYEVGDHALIQVRNRIRGSLRSEDFFARLGGDEFAILLNNTNHPQNAAEVAGRIQRHLMGPFNIQEHNLFLTASIGIAFTTSALSARDVLRNADIAMRYAKNNGRAQYAQYEESMHSTHQDQLQIESGLLRAIENNEFTLHYQPIVSLKNGRIVAVEALIRWLHPKMGLILPNNFIPVAEGSELIHSISKWVLETACHQLTEWQPFSLVNLQIAINLSARELQDHNFLSFIENQFSKFPTACQLLQIEITESTAMADIDLTINILSRLKSLGAHIAIDDFGTGYSSLAYLSRLPASSIKIDRSFISNIDQNPENQAIVSATIAMAHALNLEVVAEGVETYEQMEFLRSRQCDMAQGFFFCRPMPAEIFSKYLQEQQQLILKNYGPQQQLDSIPSS